MPLYFAKVRAILLDGREVVKPPHRLKIQL